MIEEMGGGRERGKKKQNQIADWQAEFKFRKKKMDGWMDGGTRRGLHRVGPAIGLIHTNEKLGASIKVVWQERYQTVLTVMSVKQYHTLPSTLPSTDVSPPLSYSNVYTY